jgi:DNA repair protein REV1
MREFKHMKVVTPPWITESVERGTLLNWRDYVFRPGSRLENIQGRKSTQQTLPVAQKMPRNRLPSGSTSSLRKLPPKHLQPLQDHEASPNFRSPSLEPPPPNQLQLLQDREISPPWRSLSPEPPPPNQLALQRNRHTDYISPSPEDEAHTNSYRGEQELTPPTPALPDDKTSTKTSFDRVLPMPPKPVETGSIPDPTTAKPAGGAPAYAKDKSNPYAQRVMADADWRTAHTSIAPDFIEGYYKNSRLHHLSAWKAELKALVQEAQETVENGNVLDDGDLPSGDTTRFIAMKAPGLRSPTKDKGKQKAVSDDRIIMHCDFDSVSRLP